MVSSGLRKLHLIAVFEIGLFNRFGLLGKSQLLLRNFFPKLNLEVGLIICTIAPTADRTALRNLPRLLSELVPGPYSLMPYRKRSFAPKNEPFRFRHLTINPCFPQKLNDCHAINSAEFPELRSSSSSSVRNRDFGILLSNSKVSLKIKLFQVK